MALNSQGVTDLALDDKTHFTRALKEVAPEARPMSFIIKKKASEMELMRIQAQLREAGYERCVIKLACSNGGKGVDILTVEELPINLTPT